MAILKSINSRADRENLHYALLDPTHSFFRPSNIGDICYPLNETPPIPPMHHKMSFTFRMSLQKSLGEARMFRMGNLNEDDWIRSKISNQLELEDMNGNIFPLDDIFLDNHNLPTNLRPGQFIKYYPDRLMDVIHNRNFILYVKIVGDDPFSSRLKLDNPIIIRIATSKPSDYLLQNTIDIMDDRDYRGMEIQRTELDFEILCDSCTEVSSTHFSKSEIHYIIKDFIKENISYSKKQRQETIFNSPSNAENKAIASLRDMLSEKEFRKYLINGFIMVKATSGKWYQIFKKQKHIKVYEKGILVKELCIHTDAKEVPPTDHVINMKLLVECDEQLLWKSSNQYDPTPISLKKSLRKAINDLNGNSEKFGKEKNVVSLLSRIKNDNQFLIERASLIKGRRGNHVFSRAFS